MTFESENSLITIDYDLISPSDAKLYIIDISLED